LQNVSFCKEEQPTVKRSFLHKVQKQAQKGVLRREGWIRFSEDGVVCDASRFLLLASDYLSSRGTGGEIAFLENSQPQ
jgi:hypothetical protein